MGADSLAENTPNAPESICPICLPKPKSSGFQWKKASLGAHSLCTLLFELSPYFLAVSSKHLELTPCTMYSPPLNSELLKSKSSNTTYYVLKKISKRYRRQTLTKCCEKQNLSICRFSEVLWRFQMKRWRQCVSGKEIKLI